MALDLIRDILDTDTIRSTKSGRWVPAIPLDLGFRSRIRDAWLVLTRKAEAVIWPND